MNLTDPLPTPLALVDPPAGPDLLAELDGEFAALVAIWREAVDRYHDALGDWWAAHPRRGLLGTDGADLSEALANVRAAAASGDDHDLAEATSSLGNVYASRPFRLAAIHAAVAVCDVKGTVMVRRAPAFRPKVLERLAALEGRVLVRLAPLAPGRMMETPQAALVLAECKDLLDREYRPLSALADWTTRPRGPAYPRSSLPVSVDGRLAELEGRTLPTRFDPAGGRPITSGRREGQQVRHLVV